jgi:hypothetical protein
MTSEDDLDELIEQITVDAYGDEGYWSFLQAFEDEVTFPFSASLVGVAVVVIGVDFDGHERRGLVATVEHEGTSSTISILDLDFAAGADPTVRRITAAYRRWLGIA